MNTFTATKIEQPISHFTDNVAFEADSILHTFGKVEGILSLGEISDQLLYHTLQIEAIKNLSLLFRDIKTLDHYKYLLGEKVKGKHQEIQDLLLVYKKGLFHIYQKKSVLDATFVQEVFMDICRITNHTHTYGAYIDNLLFKAYSLKGTHPILGCYTILNKTHIPDDVCFIAARTLAVLYIFERQVISKPCLIYSGFSNPALSKVNTNIHEHFMKEASDSALSLVKLFHEVALQRKTHIKALGKARKVGPELYDRLYRLPLVRVKDVIATTGLAKPNANNIVQKLEEAGILTQIGNNKRNRIFAYTPFLDLLYF